MVKKSESILKSLARLAGGGIFFLMAALLLAEKPFWALACLFAGLHVLYGEEPGPPPRRGTSSRTSTGTRSGQAGRRSGCDNGQRQPLRSGAGIGAACLDDDILEIAINPATGLPMAGGSTYGVDVGGNVYGTTSASYEPAYEPDYDYGSDSFDSFNDSFSSDY